MVEFKKDLLKQKVDFIHCFTMFKVSHMYFKYIKFQSISIWR